MLNQGLSFCQESPSTVLLARSMLPNRVYGSSLVDVEDVITAVIAEIELDHLVSNVLVSFDLYLKKSVLQSAFVSASLIRFSLLIDFFLYLSPDNSF